MGKLSPEGEARRLEGLRKVMVGAGNPRWAGDDPSYHTVHKFLELRFPKKGICEACGQPPSGSRGTEYALIHGREHSRNREDYWELCAKCHRHYDGGERHYKAKLTWEQVDEIRRRYVPGRRAGAGVQPGSERALAAEFGVARTTIRRIVTGEGWWDMESPR